MTAVSAAPRLDLSALPPRLADNWIIYLTLRSDAQARYAAPIANAAAPRGRLLPGQPFDAGASDRWVAAFDGAAADWLAANPGDPKWQRPWPPGAEVLLGDAAMAEARALVRDI